MTEGMIPEGMTAARAIKSADVYTQFFCKSVADAIRGLIPKSGRLRFRLQIAVEGRNVRVDPLLRPCREEKDHSG